MWYHIFLCFTPLYQIAIKASQGSHMTNVQAATYHSISEKHFMPMVNQLGVLTQLKQQEEKNISIMMRPVLMLSAADTFSEGDSFHLVGPLVGLSPPCLAPPNISYVFSSSLPSPAFPLSSYFFLPSFPHVLPHPTTFWLPLQLYIYLCQSVSFVLLGT